ncbi:unnamed protein product, partial [Pylaiella littoralis]
MIKAPFSGLTMAATAVPTLSYVPFDVARKHPFMDMRGTPRARARCEECTKDIATAANSMDQSDLVFVTSHEKQLLGSLVGRQENRDGADMMKTILRDPTSAAAGTAARWLVTMHKARELVRFAIVLVEHRRAMTLREGDIEGALYWLELRATSTPYADDLLFGDLEGEEVDRESGNGETVRDVEQHERRDNQEGEEEE